ncbi:MAG: flagellin FliC, partial [Candidatus Poribacteria bacterium]
MNTFRINSNSISSLAYRNLSKSQFNLQTILERLSSGLRINKASDDSAGSAIGTRMSNQIQGMKQANENAQQANNLIQTAENGLNDVSDM